MEIKHKYGAYIQYSVFGTYQKTIFDEILHFEWEQIWIDRHQAHIEVHYIDIYIIIKEIDAVARIIKGLYSQKDTAPYSRVFQNSFTQNGSARYEKNTERSICTQYYGQMIYQRKS